MYRGYCPSIDSDPRHGSMASLANREKIVATGLRSKGFRRPDWEPSFSSPARERMQDRWRLHSSRNGLRHERQDAHRWAFHDGDNVLHSGASRKTFRTLCSCTIIRDGRDIALSLKKMAGFAPCPGIAAKQ